MKKILIFTCIACYGFIGAQNSLSIAKTLCMCEPLTVSKIYPENKIYFIIDDESPDYEHSLLLKSAEKIGTRWHITKTEKLADEYSYVYLDDEVKYSYENYAIVNGDEYFYSILSLSSGGTMNNGQSRYIFTFKNPKTSEQVSLHYEKWADDPAGEYSILKDSDLSKYKNFIAVTNRFIDAAFGAEDTDINSINNFRTKWLLDNSHVYESANSGADLVKITFPEYRGKELYNDFAEGAATLTEGNFTVLSDFATPILAYDRKNNNTLVLYVPEGWPNGCCWGDRSFKLKSFKNNIVTLEDETYVLKININESKFSTVLKK